jgi:predicted MFS family arabinose efflux permease
MIYIFIFARLVISTSYRMIYPFLSAFSRGIGVDIPAISLAITARALVGTLGPLLAAFTDRSGRKAGMLIGLTIFSASLFLVVFWPVYPAFFAAIVLSTLGSYVFMPSMQAYLGDRIPYEKRGRVMGLTELNWSLSFIAGIPLVGFLIARTGWVSPFLLLGFLSLAALALIAWRIPGDSAPHLASAGMKENFRALLAHPPVWAVLAMSLLMTTANEIVNLVFGLWMEDSFGLKLAALGAASMVIGIAELAGEGISAGFVDRIGKPRAVAAGLALNCLAALALPVIGRSSGLAMVALFLFYLTFEFMIVSSLPFVTAVYPQGRGTLMAANLVALALGRAIGAALGTALYSIGMAACAAASVVFSLLAMLALKRVHVSE